MAGGNVDVINDIISDRHAIRVGDLDAAIDEYKNQLGYRLDMITPADAPREALMSKNGERINLVLSPGFNRADEKSKLSEGVAQNGWVTGRAGMEYRDLISDRLGGKLIASHIRITEGGPVADYVHYHKADFQMIYCISGRIRVVYEEQGAPFWLKPGDCVLQPPEIRHRVLECAAGSEVIEISSPAEHETWVDHAMELPTPSLDSNRDFGGQRFLHAAAADTEWSISSFDGFEERNTGIAVAARGFADVRVISRIKIDAVAAAENADTHFFLINEKESLVIEILRPDI